MSVGRILGLGAIVGVVVDGFVGVFVGILSVFGVVVGWFLVLGVFGVVGGGILVLGVFGVVIGWFLVLGVIVGVVVDVFVSVGVAHFGDGLVSNRSIVTHFGD